jgi:hypothetical protein
VAEEVRGRKGQESKKVSYIKLAQHLGINVSSEDADKLVKFAQQAYAAGEAAGIAAERKAAGDFADEYMLNAEGVTMNVGDAIRERKGQ